MPPSTSLERMIETSKPRYPSLRVSILLVMLGVCVFLWGFGYKLSLYDLQQPTVHRVPEAKLLSKNEDSQAVDGVQQVLSLANSQVSTLVFELAAITIGICGACASFCYFDEMKLADLKPPAAVQAPSLYFRPPPIQSVL